MSFLLPYNAILATLDFFTDEFPGYKPEFLLPLVISYPMLAVQTMAFFILHKIPLQFRMTFTYALNAVVTLLLVLVPLILASTHEALAYYIVIALCVVYGASVALLQASLYGTAGPCASLTNNMMLGNGLSGLCTNCLRIFFLLVLPNNYNASSQVFYYLSSIFVLFCSVLSFLFIKRSMNSEKESPVAITVAERMQAAWTVQKINW